MENIQIFLLISLIILVLIYFTNKNEDFVINSLPQLPNKSRSMNTVTYLAGKCDQCVVTDPNTLSVPSNDVIVNCPENCPKKNFCFLQGFEGTSCSK